MTGNIFISKNVRVIGESAFYGCNLLKGNLIFGDNLESIGDYAFYGCSGLNGKLILGNKIAIIGNYAFSDCKEFTDTLVIPSTVTAIGSNAFYGCTGFKDVEFLGSDSNVGSFAFSKMNIYCFDNPPSSVTDLGADFYGFRRLFVSPGYSLNFNCSAFYAIEGILIFITVFATSSICGFIAEELFKLYVNRMTNIKRYTIAFSEFMDDALDEGNKNMDEVANLVISNINKFVKEELEEDECTLKLSQANKALNMALEQEMPAIPLRISKRIRAEVFKGIEFRITCAALYSFFFNRKRDEQPKQQQTQNQQQQTQNQQVDQHSDSSNDQESSSEVLEI